MPLDEIIARPITGIQPFNELPIDAEIWHEAHEHHHHHRRLHATGAHRPGIAWGLEVVATSERTIAVAPGLGIDDEGQTVVLAEPVYFTLTEKGQTYITLSFLRTADRDSALNIGAGQQYFRIVEGRDLKATQELPRGAYLELARIYRSGADRPITDAADAFDPGNDEINTLNRRLAFPHCFVDAAIGELSYVPLNDPAAWKPNRAGLCYLLREGQRSGFHLDFSGPLNLRAFDNPSYSGPRPALLYMAGNQGFQPLADAEVKGLERFLGSGGMLWGEASGGSAEFAASFAEMAKKLGAKLRPIKKDSPLLSSHHVFFGPPPGAQSEGELSADMEAGVVFSTFDYGAAWSGGVHRLEVANARERIRQAQEFGLNIIAQAAHRKRRHDLCSQLEGI